MREYVTLLGDPEARTRDWALVGADRSNTDRGTLHGALAADGNFTVRLYQRADRDETALVASGSRAATPGVLALAAVNDSGLSGSVFIAQAGALPALELSVFYAADEDLDAWEPQLDQALAADGTLAGLPGFELFRREAKRDLDALIERALHAATRDPDAWRRPRFVVRDDLTAPATARALARLMNYLRRAEDDAAARAADRYETLFRRRWAGQSVQVVNDRGTSLLLRPGDLPPTRS